MLLWLVLAVSLMCFWWERLWPSHRSYCDWYFWSELDVSNHQLFVYLSNSEEYPCYVAFCGSSCWDNLLLCVAVLDSCWIGTFLVSKCVHVELISFIYIEQLYLQCNKIYRDVISILENYCYCTINMQIKHVRIYELIKNKNSLKNERSSNQAIAC